MSKIYRVFGEGDESELVVGEDLPTIKCACGGELYEIQEITKYRKAEVHAFICRKCNGKYIVKLEK